MRTTLCWILTGIAFVAEAQTFTTLVNFSATNGSEPYNGSLVQGTDGNFYGTTFAGGSNGEGTIFKVTPSGTLTTLYSFNTSAPWEGLVQGADGNFYGTTIGSGADRGTVFKITPGGALTTLYTFTGGADGSGPRSALVLGTDGNFYGSTSAGTGGYGTIFKVTPAGALTTLYTFPTITDATGVGYSLVQATDGNFYGTSCCAGTNGKGAIFTITSGGTFTTLHSFTGADGFSPGGSLIQATDGNLYGVASGGASSSGTVFKITTGGTLTTLYTFTGNADGASPRGLIQASDGNFYGVATGGGAHLLGTIFKLTPSGTFTTLHSFGGTDGFNPFGGLTEGSDGNLYGTTYAGGTHEDGTIFQLQLGLPSGSSTPTVTLTQNAEGGAATIAPNTWVTLKGSSLAPAGDSRTWQSADFVNNQLPTKLDGVSVTLNGQNAYVYYISPSQINILTPPNLATGTIQVQVVTQAGTSTSFAAQAQAVSPSFFILGAGPYVTATHPDGSLIGPTSLYVGLSTPAQPGETVVIYANGFGTTSSPVVSGAETQSGTLNPLPIVTIGGTQATVEFAGLISPGLFQFNVVVPASVPAGDNAIVATYGGQSTQPGTLLTIAQ